MQRVEINMTHLKHMADVLWQTLMQLIWRGTCAKCKGKYHCSGHHIIKRRFLHTRWAVMNGILLCLECHSWAENNPASFLAWLKKNWIIMYQWHEQNKNPQPHRFAEWELKETCQELRFVIKRLRKCLHL